jgi:tetratricopeptide (TPR) repeat protein
MRLFYRATCFITLALCLLATDATAQSHKACSIDKSEPTDAGIAFYRGDLKKADGLIAAAIAKDPGNQRMHLFQIDSLIGQGKLVDARKNSEAWTSADPKQPYAIVAVADIRFAEGDWLESYALNLKALEIDPCLADAYANLGQYERLSGFRATAQKHYALAHQLAPTNEVLRADWINSLDQKHRLEELKNFYHDSKVITEKKRASLEEQFNKQAAQSDYHCELASATGPARIPMTPIRGPSIGIVAWGLEVSFNGKPRVLQIDTGSSGFTLAQSVGANLGLPKIQTVHMGGIGDEGAAGADLVHADSVRIGDLEFKGCYARILHKTGLLGGSTDIGQRLDFTDGVVGTDIFDHYLVTVDYIKHEIQLDPLPQIPGSTADASLLDPLGGRKEPDWLLVDRYIAPSMHDWTKIYRNDHLLIMPTRLSGELKNNLPALFVIDTGAASSLIDIGVAKQIAHTEENDMEEMTGFSGATSKMYDVGKFTLDFAGMRLPVSSMDSTNFSDEDGVAGLIGYPVLENLVMHIDYRDNLMSFEAPSAKKKK